MSHPHLSLSVERNPETEGIFHRPLKDLPIIGSLYGRVPDASDKSLRELASRLADPDALARLPGRIDQARREVQVAAFLRSVGHRALDDGRQLSILQIGANDGVTQDSMGQHIRRFGWDAILVDANPTVIPDLEANYANCGKVHIVNAAIGPENGQTPFYVPTGDAPELAKMYSSMDKRSFYENAHHVPGFDPDTMIEELIVPMKTSETVLEEHGFGDPYLLATDVEGYDGKILETFPWDEFRPGVVYFEHCNIGDGQREYVYEMLEGHGYDLRHLARDTLGVHHDSDGNRALLTTL